MSALKTCVAEAVITSLYLPSNVVVQQRFPQGSGATSGAAAAAARPPLQRAMLLLFETAAGFALFKVNKEDKLEQSHVRHHLSLSL